MLQRATAGSRSRISLGAAASLLVIAELDRQQQHDHDESASPPTVSSRNQWYPTFTSATSCDAGMSINPGMHHISKLRRHETLQRMDDNVTKESLKSRYKVQWKKPLGEGAFGAVYLATNKQTGEKVAIKKISKKYTDNVGFQREMNALLHLRKSGGHPNICSLQENFNEGDHFYIVLDLISGGEMFDHLVKQGAYSEADAARLVREVAGALAFIHGLDTVHADLVRSSVFSFMFCALLLVSLNMCCVLPQRNRKISC
jgi:hypothetical protein